MRLKNKLAVVTAGASGMGRAGCLRFAEEGAKVAVINLNEKGAVDVARAINSAGGEASSISADLSKVEDCIRAVSETAAVLGGIDALWRASDESSYVTGISLPIDGGYIAK